MLEIIFTKYSARKFSPPMQERPVTVAESSKAWTVLACLNAGIVGSNPTGDMNIYVYVYVYSMFVLSCVGRGLAMSCDHSSEESYQLS
jgi:hypothetical protein